MFLQQGDVADIHMPPLDKGADAAAGYILHFHHALCDLRRPAGSPLQKQRDRMPGKALRRGSYREKILLADAGGVNSTDGKAPLCNRAGLSKDHGFDPRQHLKAVMSLAENAIENGAELPAEAGQGDGDSKGAGRGDQQKDHPAAEPAHPVPCDQRGDQHQ